MPNRFAIIIAATLAGAILLGLWSASPGPGAADTSPLFLVEDPAALLSHVALGSVEISTSENYIGHRIRSVEGSLENVGDRPLRSVRLRLRFTDTGGASVMDFEGEALHTPPLPAGEVHRYVFRFENLPPEWNYRVPEVSVGQVGY
jgi:hypothetical protein